MNTLWQRYGADSLLMLLPGAYMAAQDFVANGFFETADRQRVSLDLCAVDLDLAAISAGDALPFVERELLLPARADYRSVWLGGISLGGLLALCQKVDRPDTVDGLCLLAPYPGSRLTTGEIDAAGGLDAWQPTPEQLADPEFRAWQWLKVPPADCPAFVGYGTEDRFAAGMKAIAGRFPEAVRRAVPGGHDWPAWQRLWEDFLDFGLAAGHFTARP